MTSTSVERGTLPERVGHWFGVDSPWQRSKQHVTRGDVVTTLVIGAIAVLLLELTRPFLPKLAETPLWEQYALMISALIPLVWRRVYPIPVALLLLVHFFVATLLAPFVAGQFGYQAIFFFATYSAMAWARDRQVLMITVLFIAGFFALWIGWDVTAGSSFDSFAEQQANGEIVQGLLGPVASAIIYTFALNAIYVAGAVLLGRANWLQARAYHLALEQANTIDAQASELRDQAVIEERLRIARELHDVVAHHVSMMGIQAGAARVLMDKSPDQAKEALHNVEISSEQAVTELRGMLGALRGKPDEPVGAEDRSPQPTIAELPALIEAIDSNQLRVDYALEDPQQLLSTVPLPLQLTIHRTVQEALTNVKRHSTAREASVVVRVDPSFVEAEILDGGRPIVGSSGTGMGQLGMRERVASHGGIAEIGPRIGGGYRVRVRLPLARKAA